MRWGTELHDRFLLRHFVWQDSQDVLCDLRRDGHPFALEWFAPCDGRRVPLRPTASRGEFVAGVRFKSSRPPAGLHPNIPSHNPKVFDIVDLWNRHSIAGCTYYVAHPGGRSYDTFPVNANEAEARRIARFRPIGHSLGLSAPPPEEPPGDHPDTLDLRVRPVC